MVLVGLGNPGPEYTQTRHNVGFMVVDLIASRLCVSFRKPLFRPYHIARSIVDKREIVLVKPMTFMNRSGEAVRTVVPDTEEVTHEVVVVCDTLDLPVGVVRLKQGGSTAGHRGLRSVIEETGTDQFVRCYIGIDRPTTRTAVVDYVLGEFSEDEWKPLESSLHRAADALLSLVRSPLQEVMNDVNRRHSEAAGGGV